MSIYAFCLLKNTQMGYQRVIAANTHILINVQLRENFEVNADFVNLSVPPKRPSSNIQYSISVCGSEENFIIRNKRKTRVELRYYGKDEYHSITTAHKYEIFKWRKHQKKVKENVQIINGWKKRGYVSQTIDKKKKNKVTKDLMRTGISSLKELLTEQSNNMAALNTHKDSLSSKGKGRDKTTSFTNCTNSALQRPTYLQK